LLGYHTRSAFITECLRALALLLLGVGVCLGQTSTTPTHEVDPGQNTVSTIPLPDRPDLPDQIPTDTTSPLGSDAGEQVTAPSTQQSFFLAGIHASESAETNPSNSANSSSLYSVTRLTGNLSVLKFWRRAVTALDYSGGALIYDSSVEQLQEFNITHRLLWNRTQLTFTNSLATLPEGNFGFSGFGGAGIYNLVFAGTGAGISSDSGLAEFFGSASLAGIGVGSHITNVSLVEVQHSLTARSSATLAAGYGITDYYGDSKNLTNNNQLSGLADYSYLLSPRSLVGFFYGFRYFQYPETSEISVPLLLTRLSLTTHIVQLQYAHQLSHRLSFRVGAGPEFTALRSTAFLYLPPLPKTLLGGIINNQVNVSAISLLTYRLGHTETTLSYRRLVSNGSGFLPGANSNVFNFSASRPISRAWRASINAGYVQLHGIGESYSSQSYQASYAGVAFRRELARNLDLLASYQFNSTTYGGSLCSSLETCSPKRHIVLFGLSWNIRPVRVEPSNWSDWNKKDP